MQIILSFQIKSEKSGSMFQSRGIYMKWVSNEVWGGFTTQPEVYTALHRRT